MKQKTFSLLVLLMVGFILSVCVFTVKAQDTVKVSVGFTNSEFDYLLSSEYTQGLSAELDAKIFKKSNYRIGGVFRYNRPIIETSLDTYSFGPQLSVDLAKGYVTPFGRALFGLTTSYSGDALFTRTYGVGVDVNLGNIFIRPIVFDWERVEGTLLTVEKVGVGIGVRF